MIDIRLALFIFGLGVFVGSWAYAAVLAIYQRRRVR